MCTEYHGCTHYCQATVLVTVIYYYCSNGDKYHSCMHYFQQLIGEHTCCCLGAFNVDMAIVVVGDIFV